MLYMESGQTFDSLALPLPDKWCLSTDSGDLKALDVNGDSFTDLLCHNQTGKMKVLIHREGMSETKNCLNNNIKEKICIFLDRLISLILVK